MPTGADATRWMLDLFVYMVALFGSMEPDQSVWVMACMGSFCSAFFGPRRDFVYLFGYWLSGVFFSISFVESVDHFQPRWAEAYGIALSSTVTVKLFIERVAPWAAAVVTPSVGGGSRGAR